MEVKGKKELVSKLYHNSITDLMTDVSEVMCNEYCRFHKSEYVDKGETDEAFDRLVDEHCIYCPMNYLV